jgi:hypothetical protein
LAEHGSVNNQGAVFGRQAVEACRDQGGQRLGYGQASQFADRDVDLVLERQLALDQEHPDPLARIQRVRSIVVRAAGADVRLFRGLDAGGRRGSSCNLQRSRTIGVGSSSWSLTGRTSSPLPVIAPLLPVGTEVAHRPADRGPTARPRARRPAPGRPLLPHDRSRR